MLKLHKAALEKTVMSSEDDTEVRMAEEASWDADFMILYFETRLKELSQSSSPG
jgi:hypothetical protein